MIKDIVKKNEEVKPNTYLEEKLRKEFGNFFKANGKFDFDSFKEKLQQEEVEFYKEGYEMKFLGNSYARLQSSTETDTVITPDLEHNNLSENKDSENIYIVGDNLDALKHLLNSYSEQIKCIYIDPPYNTAKKDFVYPDDFKYTTKELMDKAGIEEDEANRILQLAGSSTHSAWLTFMFPRLLIASELLALEGVIFISIDDNEQANLKLLCDDIFGPDNFQGMFVINTSPSAIDYGHIAKQHEYCLMYTKHPMAATTNMITVKDKKFTYEDEIGGFDIYPLYNGNVAFNPKTRPNLYYPFYLNPNKNLDNGFFEIGLEPQEGWVEVWPVVSKKEGIPRVWRWGKEEKSRPNLNKEIVGYLNEDGEYRIVQKYRKKEKTIRSLMLDKSFSSRRGTSEIDSLFGKKVFTFPKPTELIKQFVACGSDEDSYVLDFFSGSATTAHAIMKLNAEDETRESKRKFIMVQLPELCAEDSTAYEEGYKTISDMGVERIKRSAVQVKKETGRDDVDYGFKIYKLNTPTEQSVDKMLEFKGLIVDDYIKMLEFDGVPGVETILETWKVEDGFGFNYKQEDIKIGSYTAYKCQKTLYLINKDISSSDISEMIKQLENGELDINRIVLYGYSFMFNQLNELELNISNLKNTSVKVIVRE